MNFTRNTAKFHYCVHAKIQCILSNFQIVAMEALVRYSYNSRIKDITDLSVEVDIPDSNITQTFHITGEDIASPQIMDIPNVWGHINIVATGAGQAIAQLDVNWGVDFEPFKDHPSSNNQQPVSEL